MSIKYSIAKLRNPQRPDEPAKFYAKAQTRGEASLNTLALEIARASAMTEGDVLNVLRGLIASMKIHLEEGDLVSLGEFGKFQYQISSSGSDTFKDFSPNAHIRKVNIRFRPGKMIQEALRKLSFEKVLSLKSQKEAARQEAARAVETTEEE